MSAAGTSFNFFQGGGEQNFDGLPRGRQNRKKNKLCTKTFFVQIQGGQMPPLPLANDVPGGQNQVMLYLIDR